MITNHLTTYLESVTSSLSETRLAALEEKVAGLTWESERAATFGERIGGLENQVHQFSGALAAFLDRIKLDETLLLVPEARRIEPISRTSSGGQSGMESSVGSGVMEETDGTGTSSRQLSIDHATSASDDCTDVRMEEPVPPSVLPTVAPVVADADTDMAPLPIPLPLIDVPSPVPPASQEGQWIVVGSSPAIIPIPLPALAPPSPARTRSRSPLVQPASEPRLQADEDRGSGRSRTPL